MEHLRAANFRHTDEFFTQGLAHVGHLLERIHLVVVDPLHHLLGAEFLLAHVQEEGFHLGIGETEQIYLVGGTHCFAPCSP